MSRQLSRKKFLLVVWNILRLSVTTLTADDKYSLVNKDNLTEVIQILLSEKKNDFFLCFFFFFFAFLKFRLNFENFPKRDDPYS